MERRQVLTLAAVGAGAWSGCLGDSAARSSDEALVDAEDAIAEAVSIVSAQTQSGVSLDIGGVADVGGLYDALQTSRNALLRVEEVDDSSGVELAEFYREYVVIVSAIGLAIEELDAAFSVMEAADQYADVEEHEEARLQLEVASEHLEEAEDISSEAVETFDAIQTDERSRKPVDDHRFESTLELFETYTSQYVIFTSLYRDFYGVERLFQEAFDAYEDEDWQTALATFENVGDKIDTILERVSDAEDAAPPRMVGGFVEVRCAAVSFREAAREMEFAVLASEDGDSEIALEHLEDAEAALQTANTDCAV